MTKTCTKCGEIKALDEFSKDSSKCDGLGSHCKACNKLSNAAWRSLNHDRKKASDAARYAKNPERASVSAAKWRAANKERKKASDAAWRKANSDRAKATTAAWIKANPERREAITAKYRSAHPDRCMAATLAWQKANPESLRIHKQNRRARKREIGGRLSNGLAKRLFALQRGKCACCGKPLGTNYHRDHIMPIALGGANTDDNIQLLRARCNQQKNSKHPIDFMQQRGFLL